MTTLLVVALVGALLVIMWLLVYKARHPYTDGDVERARKDALDRSHSIVSGKVAENLAPFFPELVSQFNPRDARFLGGPLDFIVFDGLDEGGEVRRVVFVEVKTGNASLQSRERRVRDAIQAGHVEYELLRLPGENVEVEHDSGRTSLEAPEAPPARAAG